MSALRPPVLLSTRGGLLRAAVAIAAAACALASATGLVQAEVFRQPSNLKYAITVAGPLLILLAALSEYPIRTLTVGAIIAAPFGAANAGLGSVRVSVIVPFLLAGALLAPFAINNGSAARLRWVGLMAFPVLALPLALGTHISPYVTTLFLLLVIAWLVSVTVREPGGMIPVLAAIVASAAIQSAIALWEARTGHLLNLYGGAGTQQFSADYYYTYGTTRRPTGAFADPISLGNFLAISLPLTIMLAARLERRLWRYVVAAAAIVIAAALALSLDRASWIGGVAGSVIAVLLLDQRDRRKVAKGMAVGAVIVCAAALIAAGPAVIGRLVSIAHPTAIQGQSAAQQGVAAGDRNRLHFWHIAVFDAFGGHPVSGVGIGNLGQYLRARSPVSGPGFRARAGIFVHAHSTYFQMLGEAGLFGLALLLLFGWGLCADAWASRRVDRVLGSGLCGGAVALLIVWVTDWVIRYTPVAACVGMVLGAIAAGGGLGRDRHSLRLKQRYSKLTVRGPRSLDLDLTRRISGP